MDIKCICKTKPYPSDCNNEVVPWDSYEWFKDNVPEPPSGHLDFDEYCYRHRDSDDLCFCEDRELFVGERL